MKIGESISFFFFFFKDSWDVVEKLKHADIIAASWSNQFTDFMVNGSLKL